MKLIAITAAVVAIASAAPAFAQTTGTLDTFVARANRVPMNPLGAVMPDARRLMNEANTAFRTVGAENRAARDAGRRPAACPPARMEVNPRQLLAFLNGIPQARRTRMTLNDGVREWMANRYPCPAS
ncbi:hypothetical protein [Brevundimonas sp. NIBR11]|uniref:hypothetical protein n=1 Tax=Brevundimonas sp. NIBR11 TaxID=3015999 RepID=UPI0022F041A9|nr:hypothetical protein [Brevundimonas sp. NIBR11]WGM31588.1 hypothetical protein KKHFBJBL_01835 [Brevundimonas sp. NIBR11]